MAVLEVLLPVFLVIATGAVLCRTGFLRADFIAGLNRLTYWVGLPAFLYHSIATASYGGGRAATVGAVLLGATVVVTGLGYLAAWLLRLPWPSVGTFVQGTMRGNLAYVGLPVVTLALKRDPGPEAEAMRTVALLAMAPLMVAFNAIGVAVLLASRQRPGWESLRAAGWQLITNPLLIASLAGGLAGAARVHHPPWLERTIGLVGQMALPVALICIGGALVTTPLRGRRTAALSASLLKVAALPLVGWGLAVWAGLTPLELRTALIFLACPTAAASYTLAVKLGGEEGLAASTVVLSTLLSALSLAAVLTLT